MGEKPRMLKLVGAALGLAFVIAPAAAAQQGFDPVLSEQGQLLSVWDGVFTEAQATRGQAVYTGACGFCHGRRLDGAPDDPDMRAAPPLARARFLRVWEGRTLGTLLAFMRATMPEDNPNSLTAQEYVDVVAYMLSVGGMPAGDDELQADPTGLARVVIGPRP
jgi:cytochrome c